VAVRAADLPDRHRPLGRGARQGGLTLEGGVEPGGVQLGEAGLVLLGADLLAPLPPVGDLQHDQLAQERPVTQTGPREHVLDPRRPAFLPGGLEVGADLVRVLLTPGGPDRGAWGGVAHGGSPGSPLIVSGCAAAVKGPAALRRRRTARWPGAAWR